MKPKEKREKLNIKLRFAAGLEKALKNSGFSSFRQLALHIGFEPAHIQRIATAKVDIALSSAVSLAEGLGISYTELASYYDGVTESDIRKFLEQQESRRRKPAKKSKPSITRQKKKKG